jgi:hypothetical protein
MRYSYWQKTKEIALGTSAYGPSSVVNDKLPVDPLKGHTVDILQHMGLCKSGFWFLTYDREDAYAYAPAQFRLDRFFDPTLVHAVRMSPGRHDHLNQTLGVPPA